MRFELEVIGATPCGHLVPLETRGGSSFSIQTKLENLVRHSGTTCVSDDIKTQYKQQHNPCTWSYCSYLEHLLAAAAWGS